MRDDDVSEVVLSLAAPCCQSCLHPLAPHVSLMAWLCGHCGLVQL